MNRRTPKYDCKKKKNAPVAELLQYWAKEAEKSKNPVEKIGLRQKTMRGWLGWGTW